METVTAGAEQGAHCSTPWAVTELHICRCHRAAGGAQTPGAAWHWAAGAWLMGAAGAGAAGACRAQCKREGPAFLCKTHHYPLPVSLNNAG